MIHWRATVTPVVITTVELAARARPGRLHVILNAVLYATSVGVEPGLRSPHRAAIPRGRPAAGPDLNPFTSEDVYFLPGAIEISRLRQMQILQRAPSGRQQLHRLMVRSRRDWQRLIERRR